MTTAQTPAPASPMEDTAGVSGMMNLTINLPDNVRISTVDSDETEDSEVAGANVTGSIIAFAGKTAPAGWLFCNGAAISRATYADLFAVIGTDYGVGNANTTFNLPDFRGRFMLGLDNMGEVSADRVVAVEADELGGSGGAETHVLAESELAKHHHQILVDAVRAQPGDHVHHGDQIPQETIDFGGTTDWSFLPNRYSTSRQDKAWASYWEHPDIGNNPLEDEATYISKVGSSEAHNNMPPYQTVNYIIKT